MPRPLSPPCHPAPLLRLQTQEEVGTQTPVIAGGDLWTCAWVISPPLQGVWAAHRGLVFFFFQNYVYVNVIKAWKGGVVGRGVKAIIWEEKKNDLSSDCQRRKRLCFRERGEGLGPEGLSGHLLAWKATSRMRGQS